MSERKLPSRKRKFSKGRAIRVSDLVYDTLNVQRYGRSWDTMLRRTLGLPDRRGNAQPLVEGMLEVLTGTFILKLNGTTWEELEQTTARLAVHAARKWQKPTDPPPALRMREIR